MIECFYRHLSLLGLLTLTELTNPPADYLPEKGNISVLMRRCDWLVDADSPI